MNSMELSVRSILKHWLILLYYKLKT